MTIYRCQHWVDRYVTISDKDLKTAIIKMLQEQLRSLKQMKN
jgi:hypothetical protein